MKYLYFDVETTGLSRTSDILEFGGILCDSNFNIVKPINEYFLYDGIVPYSAVNVHGLSSQKLEFLGTRDFISAAPDIAKLLTDPDICLCGHNIVSYDLPVLASNLKNAGIQLNTDKLRTIDTLTIAKQKFSGSHKLEDTLTVCWHRSGCTRADVDAGFAKLIQTNPTLVVDEDKTFHSALYDSYVCWCAHLVLQSWD